MNVDKFVQANNLQRITNPILLERGYVPSPDGLLSTEIFGSNTSKRKVTFAYIDLNGHFLQPLAYKTLKRVFTKLDSLIAGITYYSISKEGYLEEDPNGETGIEFLYKNWNKIKFKENDSKIRTERIDLFKNFTRDEIFMTKQIVCPPFYRDINLQNTDSKKPSVHEINGPYQKLIRLASMLTQGNFAITLHGTRLNIQQEIVVVYDYFKARIEKKNGFIRQAVLGKSDDYCSRLVISAPQYTKNKASEMPVDFYHSGLPLSHCISTFAPFFVGWIQNFLVNNLEVNGYKIPVRDAKGKLRYVKPKDVAVQFNDEKINKMMTKFIFNYSNRFDPIEVEFENGEVRNLIISGVDPKTGPFERDMTLTDLFYIAAEDILKDKHIYITRYPITDHLGIFPNRIHVASTIETTPMVISGKEYKYYPVIDMNMPKEKVAVNFVEVLQMSNVYLKAIGGDYDGDQVTVKSVFSQEANEEAEKKMKAISNILSVNGNNVRKTTNEAVQTLYMMTRW